MKWTSAQPILGVGNACFEPEEFVSEGPATVNLETNAGLIIQAEAAYFNTHIETVGKHSNVWGIDKLLLINGSNIVLTAAGSPFTIIG